MAHIIKICLLLLTSLVLSINAGTSRIVGGSFAVSGQFPYQVSVQLEDGFHTCGGTIISDRFILTASHCVAAGNGNDPVPAKYYRVRVGSIQRMAGGQLLRVKNIITNENYGDFLNDVALLELETPLVFTDKIKAIELADEETPSGSEVLISGWGRLNTGGLSPFKLKYNTLKAITVEECKKYTKYADEKIICLLHESKNGACNGDSGGPAVFNNKLVGVAGFVISGCGSANPDGYANVFAHREWILSHIN